MKKTWVLVADRKGARILEQPSFTANPSLLKEIRNPNGGLKNQDLVTDKPGRLFSASPGNNRNTTSPAVEPREVVLEKFSRQLANELESAATSRHFDQLILIAEPQVLGQIRSVLSKQVENRVIGSVDKDLMHVPLPDLRPYITDVIRP